MLKPDAALRKDRTTAPTLEHRHFAFIAAMLARMRPKHRYSTNNRVLTTHPDYNRWLDTVQHFANACAATNPRFDRARFLRACNVEG